MDGPGGPLVMGLPFISWQAPLFHWISSLWTPSLCVPEDKVAQLEALLEVLLDCLAVKRSCCKHDLLSLIGRLAHTCKICLIFLQWFINYSMKAAASLDPPINRFLCGWRHRSMMHMVTYIWHSPSNIIVFSDASGNWSCGPSGTITSCNGS